MIHSRFVLVAMMCAALATLGVPRAEARPVATPSLAQGLVGAAETAVARWFAAWPWLPAGGAAAAHQASSAAAPSSRRAPRVPGGGRPPRGGFKGWPGSDILCTGTTEPNGTCG